MDAPLHPWRFPGLDQEETTVLRNVGGVVSQRVLGTREIMAIQPRVVA